MIPDKVKYIDKLRGYENGTLELLWWGIRDKDKREDVKTVMIERGLLKHK